MRNPTQRRAVILQQLSRRGIAQVSDLASDLHVSTVTIRHDLTELEAQGLARRNRGGALLSRPPATEQTIRKKDWINLAQKDRIGALAALQVAAGDNIIIDSSSTTSLLARHLCKAIDVTVMTNGLNIAWELANAAQVHVILAGGLVRKESLSVQGSQAGSCLQAYSFDTLFLGVDGFDLQFGVTTHNEGEAKLNQKMAERAKKIIVLTDSSKFGRVSLHRIAQFGKVDTVITDATISAAYREGLQGLGIELLIGD